MLIDVPNDAHHSDGFYVSNFDTGQIGQTHLLEPSFNADGLYLIKYWVQFLAKLVCSLRRARLELYEPSDEDVYIKNLGILVGLETQPVDTCHLRMAWFIKILQYRESTLELPNLLARKGS